MSGRQNSAQRSSNESSESDYSRSEECDDSRCSCYNSGCTCLQCRNCTVRHDEIRGYMNRQTSGEPCTGYDLLDDMLRRVPVPFVQIWKFVTEFSQEFVEIYLNVMERFCMTIAEKSGVEAPLKFLESALVDALRWKSRELDPDMPFFERRAPLDAREDPMYYAPRSIVGYAVHTNDDFDINFLALILIEMMLKQHQKDYPNSRETNIRALRTAFKEEFFKQMDSFVEERRQARLSSRNRCGPGPQRMPGQQRSPWQRSPGQRSPGQRSPGQRSPGQRSPWQQSPGQRSPGQQSPSQESRGQRRRGPQPEHFQQLLRAFSEVFPPQM